MASEPERFFVPKYVGPKGWVGVRLDLRAAPDWDEMAEMIAESYCLTAPEAPGGAGRPGGRLTADGSAALRRGVSRAERGRAQCAGLRPVRVVSMFSL